MTNKSEKFTPEELRVEKRLTEKKEEAVEKIPDRETITKRALLRLEEKDYIEFGPDQGIICDLGKLKNIPLQDVQKLGLIFKSEYYGHKQKGRTLFEVFRNKEVIAKNDHKRGNLEAKPLFYAPKSEKEAFDKEMIKKQDFHLGLWEVYRKTPLKEIYPSCEDKTNLFETSVAAAVYHPKYGDGCRDKKGNLLVRDFKTREYQKINTTFFKKIGLWGNPLKAGESFSTPRLFLRTRLKRLAEKGLLSPADFRVQTGYVTAERERLERRKVDPRGGITLYGVTHYLGRKFVGKDINIYELEKGLGGITEKDEQGREKLSYTFNIFEKDPHFLTKGGYYVAKKEDVDLKEYNPEHFARPRADETKQDYQKRIKTVENWEFLLRFSQDLSEKADINISHHLSLKEQRLLAASMDKIKQRRQEVLDFAKEYGPRGLRAFVSSEYGTEYGERILEIGETLPKEKAERIFQEYGRISRLAERFSRVFSKIEAGGKKLKEQIEEAVLRRSKDILNTAYLVAKEGKAEAVFRERKIEVKDIKTVTKALKNYRQMLTMLTELFGFKPEKRYRFDYLMTRLEPVCYQKPGKEVVEEKGPESIGTFASSHLSVEDLEKKGKSYKSYLIIQSRTFGAPLEKHQDQIEFDGEARINFVWIPGPTPRFLDVAKTLERKNAISFRLDREGKTFDAKGEITENNPVRKEGSISLEIGAIAAADEPENENTEIGKTIAIGNYYAVHHDTLEKGKSPQFYHNRASFSPEFGDANTFARIVKKFREKLKQVMKKHSA